jgi:hypothetical protein
MSKRDHETPAERRVRYERNGAAERDHGRRQQARLYGYALPPREADCPPRPADNICQTCRRPAIRRLVMHHNHDTGEFIAWCCDRCNTRMSARYDDLGQPRPLKEWWVRVPGRAYAPPRPPRRRS